jgi:hypothetical protein
MTTTRFKLFRRAVLLLHSCQVGSGPAELVIGLKQQNEQNRQDDSKEALEFEILVLLTATDSASLRMIDANACGRGWKNICAFTKPNQLWVH